MEEPKRTLTRQELYDLVWSVPMRKLAKQYEMSDRGLTKICNRHLIPVPGRGHWAKIAAGLRSKQTPLRKDGDAALQTVWIGSKSLSARSKFIAEALAKAKEELTLENAIEKPKARQQKSIAAANEAASTPPSLVEKTVSAFVSSLKRIDPDINGFLCLGYLRLAPADLDRAAAFLNILGAELDLYGFTFDVERNRVGFSKHGYTVQFALVSVRRRRAPRGGDDWDVPTFEPSGRLRIEVFGPTRQAEKLWVDREIRKIEHNLEEIVETFRINHLLEKEQGEAKLREEARRELLFRRRKLKALRDEREKNRLTFLQSVADARKKAAELRNALAIFPQGADLPPDYQRMMLWATNKVREIENLTAVEEIQELLVYNKLYPDPDELFDPEGDPNPWDD